MPPKNDLSECDAKLIIERLDYIKRQTDDVHVALYGKPDSPETGLLFRMQKIEVEARTKKHMITSIVAWVSLGISAIMGIVSAFFNKGY